MDFEFHGAICHVGENRAESSAARTPIKRCMVCYYIGSTANASVVGIEPNSGFDRAVDCFLKVEGRPAFVSGRQHPYKSSGVPKIPKRDCDNA